ncbi:MAG TPA: AAA family ATPase [Ktedonobacterales bacterium]|nr:AAA family ATPase [Ktedonobacterales bacterium]
MTQDEPLAFGDVLRRLRILAGMSQEELAARASLSARAISDLERGVKRAPRRDTIQLLVEALQLSGEERAAFVASAREPAARPAARPTGKMPEAASGVPSVAFSPSHAEPPVGGFLGAIPEGTLVGREAEYAAVLAAMDSVGAGSGRLVLLAGEPGVGKTRLAQSAMLACRDRGMAVATGRCYEPHQEAPYYPFLEALSSLYASSPLAVRAEVETRWPSLLRLLPDQPQTEPSANNANPQEEQQRLFWAVTGFVHALSEAAPVALLLDDLHWADDASLALLQHLTRHTHSHRVLLLGTYRDAEVGRQHPLGKAMRDLERERLLGRVPVIPLPPQGTAQLIAARMGQSVSDEFADLVYQHTDGNPLFIQEVLRTLIERGDIYRRDGQWERKELTAIEVPESVREVIVDRVTRLSEPAQDALHAASALGQTFTFDDLFEMSGQSEAALEAALEEALAAGLAQETRDGYVFNHALTQRALYSDLSARRRRRLHLAAGEALERLPERIRMARAGELAWHYREGGAPERALTYTLLAGDHARALYATGEAEQHYRTALALAESLDDPDAQARALEKLGWLMWLLARFDESADMLGRSAAGYRALGDAEGEMRAVGLQGMLYFTLAPLEGAERISELLNRLGEPEPSKPLASLYTSLAMNLLIAGRYRETVVAAEQAVELACALDDTRMLVWAETTRGPALGMMGRLAESRQVGEAAIPLAEAGDDYFGLLSAIHYLGAICLAEGDFHTALAYYRRALEHAERLGAQSRISAETANQAETLFYLGDWRLADDLASRAVKIARAESAGQARTYFQYANVYRQVGMIHAARGEWAEASPLLEQAAALATQIPYLEALRLAEGALAARDLAQSNPAAALARLEPLVAGSDIGELGITRLLPYLAWAHAERGDYAAAERILTEGIAWATEQQHRLALVDLLTMRGKVLRMQREQQGQARHDEAVRALDDALSMARQMSYPHAEGRALYELGRLNASESEGPELFEEALAIFRRLGARPDIERTERALAQSSATR